MDRNNTPCVRSYAELLLKRIIIHKNGLVAVFGCNVFYFRLIFKTARRTASQEDSLKSDPGAEIQMCIHVRREVDSIAFEYTKQIVDGEPASPTYFYNIAIHARILPDGRYLEQFEQAGKRLSDGLQKGFEFRPDDILREKVIRDDVDQEMRDVAWPKISHIQYGICKLHGFAHPCRQLLTHIEAIAG